MAWQEMSYSREAQKQTDQVEFYTTALNSYIKFLCMGLLMLIPAISVIFPIMINESYADAKSLVPYYPLEPLFPASAVSLEISLLQLRTIIVLYHSGRKCGKCSQRASAITDCWGTGEQV